MLKKLTVDEINRRRKEFGYFPFCAAAYAPYRDGSIYPQMVVGCDDRLNRILLEELKGLGK